MLSGESWRGLPTAAETGTACMRSESKGISSAAGLGLELDSHGRYCSGGRMTGMRVCRVAISALGVVVMIVVETMSSSRESVGETGGLQSSHKPAKANGLPDLSVM